MAKKRIIDRRVKEKFLMDDEYLNGQARICGIYALGVYVSLCRHASKEQEAFPSIKLMAEELDISRDSVIKGIKSLEEHSVISIEKTRSKNGVWRNNTYILLDKKEWSKYKNQVADTDTVAPPHQVDLSVSPSRSQQPHQVADTDTKETHREGNTFKETHIVAKPQKEFNYKNQLNKMVEDKDFRMWIIALYWAVKKIMFTNNKQYSSSLKRQLRPASKLVGYEKEKIKKTMEWLQNNVDFKWTLETVGKYIDENLETNKPLIVKEY